MTDYDPLADHRLVDVEVYEGRLLAFCEMAGLTGGFAGLRVLVLGSALGGESIAANRMGAARVIGLDVDPALIAKSQEIASETGLESLQFMHFAGDRFPDLEPMDIVLSGHVIEHTADPSLHLDECLRVLRPGGYLFLEFPSRFHWRELHTGLVSFEWLPKPLRVGMNAVAGSVGSIGHRDVSRKRIARREINQELRQVSTVQVRYWIRRHPGCAIVARKVPAPGIVRLCIKRAAAEAAMPNLT